jgi:CheB methylesterase
MPRDVEAALLVVLHTADHSSSMLPRILERRAICLFPIPTTGTRYCAAGFILLPRLPHDRGGGLVTSAAGAARKPAPSGHRPLFRSTAAAYGCRVIGLILTGMLDDGTAGLMVVSARGGEAIVQDPQIEQNGFLRFRCRVGHAFYRPAPRQGTKAGCGDRALGGTAGAQKKAPRFIDEWPAARGLHIMSSRHACTRSAPPTGNQIQKFCGIFYCG